MSDVSVPDGRDRPPLSTKAAVAVLSAFVRAVNAGHEVSTTGRFLALDALDVLEREDA